MAKVTQLIDDLDSSAIDEEAGGGTLVFSVAGEFFSIDLSAKNRAAFDKAVQKFIDAAMSIDPPYAEPAPGRGRPAGGGRRATGGGTRGGTGSGLSKDELQNVRDWAGKNGYEVSPRGRIKAEVLEAYEVAHR